MSIKKIIYERRTIRKFKIQTINTSDLVELIDFARMAPSASNIQSLKYIIVNNQEKVIEVFKNTKWAGYLKGDGSPTIEQRPRAFIIVLNDMIIKKEGYELDAGASIENILLGAQSKKIGTAWLGAINKVNIKSILEISNQYKIIAAIALGYADYKTKIEDVKNDIKYYLDKEDILHIPKRKISEVILLTKESL